MPAVNWLNQSFNCFLKKYYHFYLSRYVHSSQIITIVQNCNYNTHNRLNQQLNCFDKKDSCSHNVSHLLWYVPSSQIRIIAQLPCKLAKHKIELLPKKRLYPPPTRWRRGWYWISFLSSHMHTSWWFSKKKLRFPWIPSREDSPRFQHQYYPLFNHNAIPDMSWHYFCLFQFKMGDK